MVVAVCATTFWAGETPKDTPSAAKTRKTLQKKIEEVNWDEVGLKVALEELQQLLDDTVRIKIDPNAGISGNYKITYKAKDKTLAKILDDLCDKNEWGYYVVSDKKDRRDGFIILNKSKWRGIEGKEPKKGK
jgi:hypothetical protein